MVVVDIGPKQSALVQIGEMVRIGEVWKLTQVPQPIESDNTVVLSGGLLMQPSLTGGSPDSIPAPSPKLQKLIEALQKLDQNPPQFGSASPPQLHAYNTQRADLLLQMADAVDGEEEKAQFLKQCADGIAAAVQTDAFPDGLKRIQAIEASLVRTQPKSSALPYVVFRRIMANYSADMQAAEEEKKPEDQAQRRAEAQQSWLKSLADFVDAHPSAEDTPDAMWQIAMAEEFAGKLPQAVDWYRRLATQKKGTPAADKATGAIRRLELKGKPFALSGASLSGSPINTAAYRGKVLLVVCWATWCEPCKADLPQIRALYKQYKARGFEVLGVCLDIPGGTRQEQVAQLQKYVTQADMPWPHLYEPGGLDSPPAVQYGIITLPTMFLIDPKGEVLSRNSSVQELKQMLPTLFPQK
jgi:thiol-disulfide isomerase/thioredoxin